MGNSPFGHYGETVIQKWCEKLLPQLGLDKQQYNDFAKFDGNVQNLRIVTKLQTMYDPYGINFTYGTLATIIKYPYSSDNENNPKNKVGYFLSEKEIVDKIRTSTGLSEGIRHPATFLLEAADDIVYLCDDIEDGVKKGYIPWKSEYEKLRDKYKSENYKKLFDSIDERMSQDAIISDTTTSDVLLFRNYTQGFLIDVAEKSFIENYDKIMNGEFHLQELLHKEQDFVDALKRISAEYCFSCDEVLTLEVVGKKVISELLDIFSCLLQDGLTEKELEQAKTYQGKIYKLISDNYKAIMKYDYENEAIRKFEEVDKYSKLHLIVDFVSGMTDSYAVRLYKKLLGISLP